jgi:hypothetical protein
VLDPNANTTQTTGGNRKNKKKEMEIPDEVKFRSEKWKNIDKMRLEEE